MYIEVVQDSTKILEAEQDIAQIIEVVMVITWEVIKGMGEIMIIEGVAIEIKAMIGKGVDHLKGRVEIWEIVEAWVTVDPGQVLEQVQTEIELDVSNVRKYDHFARECPTRQASRETEQIQQMFNMDEDQTILQTSLMDTDEVGLTITLMEVRDNLSL